MLFYMFVVFYTQSLVLMVQYHISTTKHSTVPVFIRYVLLCILHTITSTNVTLSHINNQTFYRSLVYTVCSFSDRCILHKITSTNVIISHINNQTFYCSLVYTVCSFMFVVFYPQSLVVMLQYHISTTKYSTVPMFIQYVLLFSLYCTHNHLY